MREYGFLTKKRIFLLIIAMLLIMFPFTIEASEIRVNSLGYSGLVLDEETDLSNNPAYLYFLSSSRIFTGGTYVDKVDSISQNNYNKHNTISDKTKIGSGYIEYVSINDGLKFSLKYEPSSCHSDTNFYQTGYYFNYTYDHQESEEKQRGANFSAKFGIPLGGSIKYGVKLGINRLNNSIHEEPYSYLYDSNGQNQQYQIDFGAIYAQAAETRIGMVLSVASESNKVDYPGSSSYPSYNTEEKSKTYEARLLPEWNLTKKLILRGSILVNNFSGKYTDKIGIESKGSGIYESIGFGWNFQYNKKTLLVFSTFHDLTLMKDYGISSLKEKQASLVFRTGIEKELFTKLKLRGCFDVFRIDFTADRSSHTSQEILTAGNFSLGYRVIDTLELDISLRSNSVYIYRNGPNNRRIDINVSSAYYFSL